MKTNRDKNTEYNTREQDRIRPKQPVYDFKPLEAIMRQWILSKWAALLWLVGRSPYSIRRTNSIVAGIMNLWTTPRGDTAQFDLLCPMIKAIWSPWFSAVWLSSMWNVSSDQRHHRLHWFAKRDQKRLTTDPNSCIIETCWGNRFQGRFFNTHRRGI